MRKSIIEIAGYDQHDPEVIGSVSDAEEFARLMDALVSIRNQAHLTQAQIAERMGTKQSAVSELERTGSNPRIRTLFRYARAVGADLRFRRPVSRGVVYATTGTVATSGQLEPIVAPLGQSVGTPLAA